MTITDKDVKKLAGIFATKDDLNRFATKDDLGQVREEFRDKFDRVLAGQDKIIKELENGREDRVFAVGKDREQDRRLDGLEVRVGKLESVGR